MSVKWLMPLWLVMFQVVLVFSQDCPMPEQNQLQMPDPKVNRMCENGRCIPTESESTCHCNMEYIDKEGSASHAAANTNKVRAYIRNDKCWEFTYDDDDDRYFEDCTDENEDCTFRDEIRICYEENNRSIDAAQALCRQFNKGDAYGVVAKSGRRSTPKETVLKRRLLAYLRCPHHPSGIDDCEVEYLPPNVTTCSEMVAHCWFSGCYQTRNIIRATQKGYSRTRYGQLCRLDNDRNAGLCTRGCFRCPDGSWDGDSCFAEIGNTVEGDLIWEPHFRTLDGKHFDFQGQCSYYLIKNGHFSIVAKFSVCGKYGVTCVSEVTITSGRTEIRLGQGNDFTIKYRGRAKRRAKKPFHNDDINYYVASSEFDAVDVWNGFKILWDKKAEIRTVIPGWNNIGTEGLLGNMNGKTNDDFRKPNGQVVSDPVEFGNSWLVPGSCPPGVSLKAPGNPVLTTQEKRKAHLDGCMHFNSDVNNTGSVPDPFKNCTSAAALLEKRSGYDNCIVDVATCTRDLSVCLCPSYEFVADFCERNGEGIGDWRAALPGNLCMMTCNQSRGEVFRMDGDPCNQSCDTIKNVNDGVFECIPIKVEGCNCPVGKARNDQGICIDIGDCPA